MNRKTITDRMSEHYGYVQCTKCNGYTEAKSILEHESKCSGRDDARTPISRAEKVAAHNFIIDTILGKHKVDHEIPVVYVNDSNTKTEKVTNPHILSFELLPPGTWTSDDLISRYSKLLQPSSGSTFDPNRILKITALNPTTCYVGIDSMWSGYHAFEFESTSKVLLESPYTGNATYIIRTNWKALSRLTKFELFQKHKTEFTRIIHSSKWFENICDELSRH